jgi:hypothetical protein
VLPLLTLKMCVGVWERIDAVITAHNTRFASYIARQAGMAQGMNVTGANALADLERRVDEGIVT